MRYSCSHWLPRLLYPMPRVSYHWLFCLTMALVLAIATPVAAGGHHGDAACVGNLAGQDSAVAWESAMVDSGELDTAAASLCSMTCAQCPASMARLANDAVASSIGRERYCTPVTL